MVYQRRLSLILKRRDNAIYPTYSKKDLQEEQKNILLNLSYTNQVDNQIVESMLGTEDMDRDECINFIRYQYKSRRNAALTIDLLRDSKHVSFYFGLNQFDMLEPL